ncbi:hypothetical protein HMPREF1416_00962, partial [Helicobacter pylori GAM260ASi]
FFKLSFFLNSFSFWSLMKNLFSFEPPLLNPLFLGGLMKKSFLAFLVII